MATWSRSWRILGLSPTIVRVRSTRARRARFSASSWRWCSALRMTSTVLSSDSGFSTKSNAPNLIARTADSMFPCPEISTTCESTCRSRRRASVASPSMPGSHTSSTIRSNGPRVIRSRQASPLATASTAYPSSRSTPLSALRTPGSSSTMRMVGFTTMFRPSHQDQRNHENTKARRRGISPLSSSWLRDFVVAFVLVPPGSTGQLYGKPRSARHIVADVDAAAVLGNNPADDGQAEAAAPALGRIVRQEQLLALGRRNARTVVGHDHAREAVGLVALRFHQNRSAPIHGLDRVVDKVDDDAAHLLDVQPDERDTRREALLDANVAENAVVERERLADEVSEISRH